MVLLPTRRAARSLAEAFLKTAESPAVLLPHMRALGDLDEGEPPFETGDLALDLPPAIEPARRRFELAGLVAENQDLLQRELSAGSALELADALAGFLDACQIEETGEVSQIETLVEGDLAQHWRLSADFLALALDAWPRRLEALGLMDVAARRVALLRRLEARWRDHPTSEVLIAAGSTGSTRATADLLAAIAQAPRGCVVLPGLDKSLADDAWALVDEQHPQGALRRLIERAGITRGEVRDWDPAAEAQAAGRWRRRLINEALRPPEATADWLAQIAALRAEGAASGVDPIAAGLEGLSVVTARTEEEAATAAALMLRETLESPGKTCALITPDAALARRVSAKLTRWDITADSSAGQPLAGAPAAVLASLAARTVLDPADPVTLLAIVKHPLTQLGLEAETLSVAARWLERGGLRGPRPGSWDALNARLRAALERARAADPPPESAISGLSAAIEFATLTREALALAQAPYTGETATPAEAARSLIACLEALTAGPRGAAGELWRGQGGEGLGVVLASLIDESEGLPEVTRAGFADLLDGLLARALVRAGGASHPRLRILGAIEARLVRADRLILAGLEEGVWPAAAPIDPFLSRPMRERLGLPPPERRIGLSAHDFAQAACAPEVVLLHSERRGRRAGGGLALALAAGDPGQGRGPRPARHGRTCSPGPGPWTRRCRSAPRAEDRAAPRADAAGGGAAAPAAGHRRRALGPRSLRRLRPLHSGPAPAGPARRAGGGPGAGHGHPRRLRALRPRASRRVARRAGGCVRGHPDRGARRRRHAERPDGPRARPGGQCRAVGGRLRAAPAAGRAADRSNRRGELAFAAPGGVFTVTAKADRIEVARRRRPTSSTSRPAVAPSAKQVRTRAFAAADPHRRHPAPPAASPTWAALAPAELVYVRVSGGRIPGGRRRAATATPAPWPPTRAGRAEAPGRAPSMIRRTPYLSWAAPQFIGQPGGRLRPPGAALGMACDRRRRGGGGE